MAEPRGLIRKVRLLLDRRSADKTAKDSQRALDKGTDPKQAKKNLKGVEGAFGRLKSAALKVGAVLASLWVVKQVAQYTKAVFTLGSAVLAVGNQFEAVFGPKLAKQIRERTDDFRKMASLTTRQFQELMAGAGSMGQGFGMANDASADFAQQIVELSADLASFNNVGTAEAAQLVQSALIGNTERGGTRRAIPVRPVHGRTHRGKPRHDARIPRRVRVAARRRRSRRSGKHADPGREVAERSTVEAANLRLGEASSPDASEGRARGGRGGP